MRGSFRRAFDAVIAWGMMFLLSADVPKPVIRNVARRSPVGEQFGKATITTISSRSRKATAEASYIARSADVARLS